MTEAGAALTVDAIDGGYAVLRDGEVIFSTVGDDATEALNWAFARVHTVHAACTLLVRGRIGPLS